MDNVPWRKSADPYYERGLKCSLWDHKVKEMDRADLIAFIGFLDELSTDRHEENKRLINQFDNQ